MEEQEHEQGHDHVSSACKLCPGSNCWFVFGLPCTVMGRGTQREQEIKQGQPPLGRHQRRVDRRVRREAASWSHALCFTTTTTTTTTNPSNKELPTVGDPSSVLFAVSTMSKQKVHAKTSKCTHRWTR